MNAHILDETHPLEKVLVWGEPGIEALLGQLLPQTRSLFRSYYEVPKARGEFACMSALIENEGIRMIRAKDATAELLKDRFIPALPASIHDLKLALFQRADSYIEFYRHAKQNDLINDGLPDITPEDVYSEVKRDIGTILEQDIAQYGEQGALRLNYLLSLSKPWPMANIFYGRDQSQVIADRVILSSLRWNIRKPEVRIFKDALHALGFGSAITDIREGTIEGGDIAMFNGCCFVGVGARTSLSAVKELCRQIGESLKANNIQLIAVINKRQEEESNFFISPTSEHMQVMHLDMFWIPLSSDLVMAYTGEMDEREAALVTREKGRIITEKLGSFREFLRSREIEIFEVNEAEQKNFATNLLNLGNKKVIAALSSNPRVNAELEKRGFTVKYAELTKLVDGYGAVHCLTAPVKRAPSHSRKSIGTM
jgi:arginine deiminase